MHLWEMTVAQRLYLMSYVGGICGTKGLTQRQVNFRVSLIRSYDIDPMMQRGLSKGWRILSADYLRIRINLKALPKDTKCRDNKP
eukprot:5547002-Pleurochrysis_carterae.AAC.3